MAFRRLSKQVASFAGSILGRDSVLGGPKDEGLTPAQHSPGLWKIERFTL